ncbi:hypothetical protein CK203_047082 [Vitis vinifera]|uniref:Retrotransposon Copia-like N-terminal domain-containing protein n=1 Tax=Vitis vinifera TaxID=29760 RepID=A0A438HDL0_VITVI|nr:hypothetical protein CK203_047082 [Vitis vinifera]
MADSIETILDNLTSKMTEALSMVQTSFASITNSPMVPLSIKLDGSNYGLWSQVVEMYILRKDKLGYINGDYPQLSETDPSFRKWRTENSMVKGWLINSMDHSLVVNFISYPTAKQVWDSAATTYFDGTDTSQRHELQTRKKRDTPTTENVPGIAAVATTESQLSLIPVGEPVISTPDQGNCGQVFCSSTTRNDGAWIIVSGATDHMTFNPNYFSNTTQPRKTCIANANGAIYLVTRDVLSEEIIGHGTKRGGLYYLDDFSPGKANHTHHQTSSHERQI